VAPAGAAVQAEIQGGGRCGGRRLMLECRVRARRWQEAGSKRPGGVERQVVVV